MPNSRGWGLTDASITGLDRLNALSEPLPLSAPATAKRVGLDDLASTIENIIVPRLLMSHVTAADQAKSFTIELNPSLAETFADLSIRDDPRAASTFVQRMLDDGVPFEHILLDLLAPAARILGDKWVNDLCSFVDVTIGVARMHRILREFNGVPQNLWKNTGLGHRALLMPVPGEQHTFGIRMVEEFLLRDGWEVDNRFPATDKELKETISSSTYDFVGFSLSHETLIKSLVEAINTVRSASLNRQVRVMVGGVIFSEQPALRDMCGADAYAPDAVSAVRQANDWIEPAL
jgi:MerR family transcriptional regulator, light-induced transcriptional regulator